MKKTLAIVLILVLALSIFSACDRTTETVTVATPEPEEEVIEMTTPATSGEGGGFPVAPLYFYTNMYCLADGIENVWYTPFGYYFFTGAT
ncbi:MAG: hypothetical protein AB1Z19_09120, partial [Eubacteriales bacterium]